MPLVVMDEAGPGGVGGAGAASPVGAMELAPKGSAGRGGGAQRCWGQLWWALLRARPGSEGHRRGKGPWQGLGDLGVSGQLGWRLQRDQVRLWMLGGLNSCSVEGPFLIGTDPARQLQQLCGTRGSR